MYTKLLIKIIRIQIFLYSLRERERENVYVRQLIYHEFKVGPEANKIFIDGPKGQHKIEDVEIIVD